MWRAYITEIPRFVRNTGDFFLITGITLNKSIPERRTAKGLTKTTIGKVRTDEIYIRRSFSEVNRKPGFMLAASRKGYILPGKGFAVGTQGVLPKLLLFGMAAPAGNRYDFSTAANFRNAGGKQTRCPTL